MFKPMHLLCTSFVAITMGLLQADQSDNSFEPDFFSTFPTENNRSASAEVLPPSSETPHRESSTETSDSKQSLKKAKPKTQFKPFTGKVKGKKVRLRTQPDLDSSIAKELLRGDYISVVDEADDFWAIEAPSDLKAYVFRSFVLDNIVEGNRVNVRLHPTTEAPVISHLNSGDFIEGSICPSNHKWLEIKVPSTSRFYIAKNYVENVGGPEVKQEHETRLALVKQQLELAEYFAESEMKKEYNEIDFDRMNNNFLVVIQEYSDFSHFVEKAKDNLAGLQEKFIDKRISYMENKAAQEEAAASLALEAAKIEPSSPTDKMRLWEPVEEALFLSWANIHEARDVQDYHLEQKIAAHQLTGILEPYSAPVKCKPGDYIIRQDDLPIGYVYSTVVNLQNLVGKKVSLIGSPRPNNNFAFPAYFVLGVEE